MLIEIGKVEALFRYPVKSMAGEQLESAELGWHGIDGDRRLALNRVNDHAGFPWLTASKLPELIRYVPVRRDGSDLPTHIRTPNGEELPVFSDEFANNVADLHGAPVQMMRLRHGIFDDAPVSVITSATVNEIARIAERSADARRFRPNILVRLHQSKAFEEDRWLGSVLRFGEAENAPSVAITMRDLRCAMINLDPDTATIETAWMKAAVRANQNNAGVYGTVTQTGRIGIGQPVFLQSAR